MADYRTISTPGARVEVLNAFMRGVYQWMAIGLGVTGVLAYMAANTPAVIQLFFDQATGAPTGLFWVAVIGELGLVFVLAGAIKRLSASTATALFVAYSALNGLTLSYIFIIYTQTSIVATFMVCAGMFGAMSVYGMTTKKDLTSWGSFLIMGVIGIVIAMIVNMFLQSSAMHFVISILGVIIFTGLTAYDTQKLKVMGETAPADDAAAVRKATIFGALTLYLDFINLFLMLLRLMGDRR